MVDLVRSYLLFTIHYSLFIINFHLTNFHLSIWQSFCTGGFYQSFLMQTTSPEIRLKQELINSIMHGFGILFGIISIPILITLSVKGANVNGIVGSSIYGFCFLM